MLRDHAEAMECRDCEDCLRLGLQAFEWIRTAHAHFQADVLSGDAAFDDNFEQVITGLYATWLAVSEVVEPWVAKLENRGYTVEAAGKLRECCQEARDAIEERSLAHAARRAAKRR